MPEDGGTFGSQARPQCQKFGKEILAKFLISETEVHSVPVCFENILNLCPHCKNMNAFFLVASS